MIPRRVGWMLALAGLLSLVPGQVARAAIARFHYVPNGPNGALTHAAAEPGAGERISVYGVRPDPYVPRPTVMIAYRHPSTGQTLNVPLALPLGTPHIYHRGNRIVYDYSGYTVQVVFLADGSVDVVYNSGLFRGL
jgi:hypothetical protein